MAVVDQIANNITTLAAGDLLYVGEDLGGGSYQDGKVAASVVKEFVGAANLKSIYVPAYAIVPSATGGCAAPATIATSANQPDIRYLAFDATTAEYAQFAVRMPKNWDEGTITALFLWTHPSTTTNFGVRWGLQAVALSNDDAIAAAYGTAQEVTDTGGTTHDHYVSDATSAITIAGTPATGDEVNFRVYRDPANGGDTMAVDAWLKGVVVFYNTNTLDEA